MSKAIVGAVEIAGVAAALITSDVMSGGLTSLFSGWEVAMLASIGTQGVSMEAGAIADALTQNRGMGITTRQPAAFRQIIYGEQRVAGVIVYCSTTGSSYSQYNLIIVLAGHEIDSIINLYLDGRQVYWEGSGDGWTAGPGGVYFGGNADSNNHTGPNGQQYNFGGGQVYCEARYGNQPEGDVIGGMTANDPTWATSSAGSPSLLGCAYVYLKLEYNPSLFPSLPEIKFTIRGKNNIYDPRTGTTGWTNNWALVVADVITDPVYGLGDNSVNQAQLIAAANVCDTQIPLGAFATGAASGEIASISFSSGLAYGAMPTVSIAITGDGSGAVVEPVITQITQQGSTPVYAMTGLTISDPGEGYTTATATLSNLSGWSTDPTISEVQVSTGPSSSQTEAQWACNYHYDTGTAPGDVLQTMMPAAQGRLSRIGGEWYIWPAYWQGPSVTWDESSLTGDLEWTPYRSFRELINRVYGTYIAPNFPWNIAGNLYDSNGFWNGQIQNNFPFAFQPTNYPYYATDTLHGYPEDQYLIADGNIQLPLQLVQNCVLSVTQAQRAAKVALLRNRQQGSGTFRMKLDALQMQPLDVMQFTLPLNQWSDKLLEVKSISWGPQESQNEEDGPYIAVVVEVQETDPSVYEWSMAEELSVYDVRTYPGGSPYQVGAPTDVACESDSTTALIGRDGIVTPRILVTWTAPTDATVTQIQTQFQEVGASGWTNGPVVPVSIAATYITGVVAGESYNVQIASLDAKGATSAWVEVPNVLVDAQNSSLGSYVNTPAIALSMPSQTTIQMASVSVQFGGAPPVTYAARTFTIPTPTELTTGWYYVTITDPNQTGDGSTTTPTLTATCQQNAEFVGVPGNTYIGAALVLLPNSGVPGQTRVLAGGWPAPTTFQVGL